MGNMKEKTTAEKMAVIQHWIDGGRIEIQIEGTTLWEECTDEFPTWNWGPCDYRIMLEASDMLYEWWILHDNGDLSTPNTFHTEAWTVRWGGHPAFGKTGRYFNPDSKEFGVLHQ